MKSYYFKDHADLTPQVVTNLFLYGVPETPPSPAAALLLNARNSGAEVAIDAAGYMAKGPGRYARASRAGFVRDFFEGDISLPDGNYNAKSLVDNHGFKDNDFRFLMRQHHEDPHSADYGSRSYIFASGNFRISPDTRFIVRGQRRYAENMAVYPELDNFDFAGGGWTAKTGNRFLLQPVIDRDKLGKKVLIQFTNPETIPAQKLYTSENYQSDRLEVMRVPGAGALDPLLPVLQVRDSLDNGQYPSLENLSDEDIETLIGSPEYGSSKHPGHDKVYKKVTAWFQKKQGAGKKVGKGSVHVRAHTREGGREQVRAYDRSPPHNN